MRKFIVVVTNQKRFDEAAFGEDKIINESVFTWYPVKSTDRAELVVEI